MPNTCTALLNNFVFFNKMAFVSSTNYFFNGPLFIPPPAHYRFCRYLYLFNVTQIDRVIKIFILLRTNGRTNISMIYNLTLYVLFQGQYTRRVNSGLGLLSWSFLAKSPPILLAARVRKAIAKAAQYTIPWPCTAWNRI